MSNIIQFGLDVASFNDAKKATLHEFIELFDTLSKYDGAKISPSLGAGFSQINTSIKESKTLLDEMQKGIANLNTQFNANSSSVINNSKSQNELSLAMGEYSKNANQAAVITAKLSVATSEQAKETMALKLQLSETSKALLEEAKANNASVIAKQNAKNALAAARENEKNAQNQEKIERQQVIAAMKAEIEIEKQVEREKKEEIKINKALENDYNILKQALKDQINLYQQLHIVKGKDDPATKQALKDVSTTSAIIEDVDGQINKATNSSGKFGSTLSEAFSQLRTIAYILPGIGIAGIFNLAYEAIGKALENLGLFSTKEERLLEVNTNYNNSLKDTISLYEEINDKIKDFNSRLPQKLYDNFSIFGDIAPEKTSYTEERKTDLKDARGISQDIILAERLNNSLLRVNKTRESFKEYGNGDIFGKVTDKSVLEGMKNLESAAEDDLNRISELTKKYAELEEVIGRRNAEKAEGDGKYLQQSDYDYSVEQLEKQKDNTKSSIELNKALYNEKLKTINEYYDANQELEKRKQELDKFNSDEERKRFVEVGKSRISVNVDEQKRILADDRNLQKERLQATKELFILTKENNRKEYENVVGTKDNPNVSVTPKEKIIVDQKLSDDNKKAQIKYYEEVEKINIEFYQRKIKAEAEIAKQEQNTEALNNEKIFKDDTNSLEQRLIAYKNYVIAKQNIQDIEYNRDIQRGSSSQIGKTNLTKEESEALDKNRVQSRINIEANASREIYDIVSSFAKKELDVILDTNRLQEQERKREYTEELRNLNTSFEEKKISFRKYRQERQRIDLKYVKESQDKAILDDRQELQRLKELRKSEIKTLEDFQDEAKSARKAYEEALNGGNKTEIERTKKELDKADSKVLAQSGGITNTEKAVLDADKKLQDDELKRWNYTLKQKEEAYKQFVANNKAITDALFEYVKTVEDAKYDRAIEVLEKEKEAKDEAFETEKDGIDSSSLNAKDKAALEIQIAQQKREFDKQNIQEQKKLQHDKAIFDRDLAVAHVIWNTQDAISAALTIPPPAGEILAGQRAILGTIQVATILAKDIPAYAEGTSYHQGGLARTGEAGAEVILEPNKVPYMVLTDNISNLPKGTEVIPINQFPEYDKIQNNSAGWEQFIWLAAQMKKNNKEVKNVIHNSINIDLGFESFKTRKLFGK